MKISRRRFLIALPFLGAGTFAVGGLVEPRLLHKTRLDMRQLGLGLRIVHFSDLHYKGDAAFGKRLIEEIRALQPDYVVFTGDLVENKSREFLSEALDLISSLPVPVFGVLGNHDPTDEASWGEYARAYKSTGGAFLNGDRMEMPGFVIHGSQSPKGLQYVESRPKLLLCHYPIVGDTVFEQPYDLILAGHSHGGQIRLPWIGSLVLPPGVGLYDRGYFETPAGPLYVNQGVGTYLLPVRLFCRPEITEILL